jgi:hypothetical protein
MRRLGWVVTGWMLGAAVTVGMIAETSCGSSSTPASDAGPDGHPTKDGGPGAEGAADSAPDHAKTDAAPAVDAGAGCFVVTGSGSAEKCTFTTCGPSPATTDAGSEAGDEGGASEAGRADAGPCADVPGASFGSCPSAGLYGCCVQTVKVDGGGSCLKANCYYSSTADKPQYDNCIEDMYEGLPYAWQYFSP